jgi:ABC-type branched-subunit amino acid transport system substrate-binding protein
MKNKATWVVAILIIVVLGAGLAYRLIYIANHPPIYIAVFVPGEEDGVTATENTLIPIQMYLEEINAKGGINGHPLKLVVKEDSGTVAGAEQAISEINDENQAMIVLGHAYSDPASAIGPTLTDYGIPAITSGATAPQVTIDHPWFFRVVTNNTSQGRSIAAYAIEVLGIDTAAIVYEDNKYGQSLGDGFEKAFQSLGGTVFTKAAVGSESETLEQDVTNIVRQINQVPDMVFLATYKTSGAATVIALKENNVNTLIVGGDDIGDTAFLDVFPEEIQQDVHYLDNVYAASPLIFDVASEKAQLFKERYIDRTDKIPTWFCATSYDSTLIAVQAMLDAGISADPGQLSADRQKVRDQLAKYNSSTTAVPGISGNLYFDKTNDVVQPAAIGVFINQNFISAPIQIQLVTLNTQVDSISKSYAQGDLFYTNNQPVYKTKIVYVGTDINEFSQIDIDDEHIFTADFYLWFRYTGDLEIENIIFDNVEEPVELEPIKTAQYEDVTYKLYRAKATFSGSYDLFQYPFDRHKLRISFRHPDYDRYKVIFVADQLGMGDINNTETLLATFEQSRAFEPITDWFPVTGSFFQDVIHEYTNRGDPTLFGQKLDIQYSRFNITVEVRRDVIRFLTKTMLPLLFLITLAYLGFFLPGNQFEAITGLMTGTLLSVVFFHVDLSGRLRVGYTVIQDYLFYIIYGMLTVELFLSIIAWHKQDDEKTVKKLFWSMRIIYPLAIILGSVIVLWAFGITI